jgi:amino acid transporter
MILGVFAFMGMETALGVSGEVKAPERNVPRAILGALVAVTLLYIAIQATAQSLLGDALKTSTTPLADAMGRVSPVLQGLLLIGAVVSMLGYLASNMLTAPRILFAMARDGLLPRFLGAVHQSSRTPTRAILVHGALVVVLAVSGAFAELAVLSTLVTLIAYIGGCVAAVVLQRRGVADEGAPLNFAFTPAAAAVGVVSMVWIAAQGTWQEVLAVLAALGAASLVYLVSRRRRGPTVASARSLT